MIKKICYSLLAFIVSSSFVFGQCDLTFDNAGAPPQFSFATQSGSDIVNGSSSGAYDSSTQSFDIWDETSNNCSTGGGVDDIIFQFEIIHAFDQYGVDGVIDAYAGATHDIVQTGTGIAGGVPLGNTSTNESSTGDVRGYKITVNFASHIIVLAQDITVNLTSVNTSGGGHESSSLVFLNGAGTPYGTATYEGYYEGTTGASTDGTCLTPAVRTNSWAVTTGAYTASSTVNIDITDPCNPVAGSNGANDNYDVNPVTDTGLNPTDEIGGFVFTVYMEDVAASSAPGANTTTSTLMTSTLNGITIDAVSLPVELISFEAALNGEEVEVDWTTASEENNDYFDVQWSNDGVRFETIATLAGQGTDVSTNHYRYTHLSPANGNNYYRLQQIDYDRSVTYSDIRMVRVDKKEDVLLFPTLVQSELHVVTQDEYSSISIYNSNGILVKQVLAEKPSVIDIQVSDLAVGAYFVAVQTGGEVSHARFIKE